MNINRNHKNSVFSALFSNADVLRELYSAIEGVTIPPDIPVDINTLTDILYMDQINDVSFTIDNRLVVLIEHQATINNNLPLRLLLYIARIYEKIINRRKRYQIKLEKIPAPEFIVLYNGSDPYPDYAELRLSDAFKDIEGLKLARTIPLELIVQVYNINQGHNSIILEKCETLENYSIFIDKIREYEKQLTLDESVNCAIKYCTENNILKKFLEDHGSEVFNMLLGEWNWDEALEVAREEGHEEGVEFTARNALIEGFSTETVQKITGLDLTAIEEIRVKTPT
jgi:predicted transposase/invertase (TIGR01784 family)